MTGTRRTPPSEVFAHKTVFFTGATGFLGKAMVEKLLRTVPSIERIYVLIRPNKELTADDRLETDIIGSPIFDRLRQDYGSIGVGDAFLRSKLRAVAGDVASPRLGLSDGDFKLLQRSVQIVVHSAAIVQLNQPLDVVFQMNCVGALNMLAFVESCRLLKCYMHVSTAFVNSNLTDGKAGVREELYPLRFDVEKAFAAITKAKTNSLEIERLTKHMIGNYPNTYTLTKSMAEHLVSKRARPGLPLVIFRPTIICGSMAEPVPGWIDQIAGAGALLLSIGTGLLTIFPGRPENVADVVPVDLTVNTALVAIAAVASGYKKCPAESQKPFIVHSGTSDVNPFHWELAGRLVPPYFRKYPSKQSPLSPKFRMIKTSTQFKTEWFIKYTLPVSLYGTFANLSLNERRKTKATKLKKLSQRARKMIGVFEPFAMEQWIFQTTESRSILQEYAAGSESEWWLDAATIDWEKYVTDFCTGLKKNILHEDVEEEAPSKATVALMA